MAAQDAASDAVSDEDARLLAPALARRTASVRKSLTVRWDEVRHLFSCWGAPGIALPAFSAGLQNIGLSLSATKLSELFALLSNERGEVELRLLDLLLRPGGLSDQQLSGRLQPPPAAASPRGAPSPLRPPTPGFLNAPVPHPVPRPKRALH